MSDRLRRVTPPILTLGIAVAIWWVLTVGVTGPDDMVRRFDPFDGFSALGRLLADGTLRPHVVASLRRLAVGLGAATVLGVLVGAAIGWWRSLDRATGPLFQVIRMVSPLAWTPIVIIVVGIGDRPVQVLVALAAMWPVVLGTAAGIRALDPGWLLVARSLGANRRELIRSVVAPGIAGSVSNGLRLALGVGWIVVVPAEMLGVDSGLGYFVLDSRDRLAYDELTATVLVIGVLGALLDGGVRRLGARFEADVEPTSARRPDRHGATAPDLDPPVDSSARR